MRKYLLGVLLCVMLLAMFAGCRNGGNEVTPDPDPTPPVAEQPPVTPDPPPAVEDDDEEEEWQPPEIVVPEEEEEPEVPGTGLLRLVETPEPGRLLGRNNVPLTRAEILEIVAQAPEPAGELVSGSTTRIQGNFVGGFSSEMSGAWVTELLHGGRGTMVMDFDGQWIVNPMVIRQPTDIVDNADGTRTYTFHIYTDNLWSDGTPITAIDYVFGIMAYSSPAMRSIGATVNTGLWIDGFFEFLDGRTEGDIAQRQFLDADGNLRTDVVFDEEEGAWLDADGEPVVGVATNYFRGLRLLSDNSFSVTIRSEGIPFVWDFLYQSWGPTPFHYWSQGWDITITDTPNGARIDGLTEEWASTRINAPAPDGIRYNPTVHAGPYRIRSWDPGDASIILERNPVFQGTWDGFMPQIQTLAIVDRANDVIMDALRIGEIDIVHAMRSGPNIAAGWDIVNDLGTHRAADFPRHGYGYMAWHGDHGPGQFSHVRRAVAWMIDRYDFARQFTGGWGTVQHGPYALRGWEFQMVGHELYAHPDFTHYGLNPANALAELIGGGWVLNSEGEPFDPDVDQWRYKDVTGMTNWMGESLHDDAMTFQVGDRYLMRLEMIWAANDNDVSNIMRVVLPPVAEGVGMHIIEELYPAAVGNNIPAWQREPGSAYAPGGERFRAHHIYTLAVGLASPSQLWNQWSNYPEQQAPGFNTTWHGDQRLHDLAWAMRPIDASQPGWEEEYLDLWLQFQLHYNYVMPLLPLYADDDHDFIPLWLGNWDSHGIWDWRFAVLRSYDGRTR